MKQRSEPKRSMSLCLNWQGVAAIASSVAALVASFIAYLNYRARPLAVRAVELHSLKFQEEILPAWKSRLPNCPDVANYDIDEHPFYDEALCRMQTSELFRDLANHLPPGNRLMLLWRKYGEEWEGLERSRSAFARKVRYYVDQNVRDIGLQVGTERNTNVVIEYHLVHRYYNAILELCRGRSSPYEALVKDVANLRLEGQAGAHGLSVSGSAWVFNVDNRAMVEQAIELLRKLVNGLPTAKLEDEPVPLLKEATELCQEVDSLRKLREQIQSEIENLIALPLLPNCHCPLLKVVEEPLAPRWLTKLASRFFHRGGKGERGGGKGKDKPISSYVLSLGTLFFAFGLILLGLEPRPLVVYGCEIPTLPISVYRGLGIFALLVFIPLMITSFWREAPIRLERFLRELPRSRWQRIVQWFYWVMFWVVYTSGWLKGLSNISAGGLPFHLALWVGFVGFWFVPIFFGYNIYILRQK